ncbi:MAG: PIG-L family deacetylase [Candidatus Omnitrophica bacterium]|nr:PIG-L family deacetylase [Candidatus Omnitrophota bacterium]
MNILAIGAHPDDIEFGCGGTLIKYADKGHNVHLFVLTDGSFGAAAQVRKKEQDDACAFIGAKGIFWADYRDTELTVTRDLITKIDEVINKVNPDIVFLNNPDDVHQDHRAASLAGISASRYIKEVLFFEVPTTERFEPDIFVDINDVLDKKIRLLEIHSSQVHRTRVQNLTIVESVRSCANFRGFQGRVKYAEGFKALRSLREVI